MHVISVPDEEGDQAVEVALPLVGAAALLSVQVHYRCVLNWPLMVLQHTAARRLVQGLVPVSGLAAEAWRRRDC